MRYSSERQMAFEYSAPTQSQGAKLAGVPTSPLASTTPPQLPDFSRYGPAYAATSRIAGRINAANISDGELNELLRERQKLLDKQFEGVITRKEFNKLEYIRWTLDRIEDARHGHALEMLDSAVSRYEQILEDLHLLGEHLGARLRTKKAT